VPQKTWKILSTKTSSKNKNWLTLLLAKNRGLKTKEELKSFLNPTLEQILKVSIGESKKALKRIEMAITNKEKIIVYSDYDADGISATAIMWETLYDLGADVMPYVPHRIKEGYGLSNSAITKLVEEGAKLIITVDHGVSAVDQIEHANSLGIDVIITDHHVLPKVLPKSYAMVHTTTLCGAGVSWRLAWDIVTKLKPSYREQLENKLELAAIATIADLVPLTGANRAIVKIGLEKLSSTKRYGINALLKTTTTSSIGTYEIGHILAPRINAMGRIEHGLDALRLICAKSKSQADKLASLLSKTNSKRQDLTTRALESAKSLVSAEQSIGVIAHHSWHEGVIGLVASRLVETYNKPFIVISQGEVFSKGSARSVPGFNIVEAIRASSQYLVAAGGHPMAAGFTIETRHIQTFSLDINQYAKLNLTEEMLEPIIRVETELEEEDISGETLEQIKKFEPFGVGNMEPVFLTRKMLLEDVRTVGKTSNHLKLQIGNHSAIGFNMGDLRTDLRPGQQVDLLYTISEDKFNGHGKIQLKIKDLKLVA